MSFLWTWASHQCFTKAISGAVFGHSVFDLQRRWGQLSGRSLRSLVIELEGFFFFFPGSWAMQLEFSPHFQFSSVSQSCPTLCAPMDCSTPGLPVHHQLPEFTQTHIHWVSDAIQPAHPLLPPSPPAFNLSQHQGLFQLVSSLHQVAKVLELQLQSFQWILRTDFL